MISKSIIEKKAEMGLNDPKLLLGSMSFEGRCVPYGYCTSKVNKNWCFEVAIVIQITSINSCWGCNIWSNPKSYNRYYVHFCVPWILEVDSNDLYAGTTNDYFCCFFQLPIHVGTHFTCRYDSHKVLWAVWPCNQICRWVLPLHHHPQ